MRPLMVTVVLAVLVFLFSAWPSGGIFFVFFAPFIVFAIFRNIYLFGNQESGRNIPLSKAFIWLTVLVVVIGMHISHAKSARTYASHVADSVLRFKAETGNYPEALESVGVDPVEAEGHMLIYSADSRSPGLMYVGTFMPLYLYRYNFRKDSWEFKFIRI